MPATAPEPTEPLRIFIGTDESQVVAHQVLAYSIRKHASVPVEIRPIFDESSMVRALESGRKILVPGDDALRRLRQVAQGHFPFRKLSEARWRRWKLQGQDETGRPAWRRAWETGDLSVLERNYFVVFLAPP
jgi:hypothetical protein